MTLLTNCTVIDVRTGALHPRASIHIDAGIIGPLEYQRPHKSDEEVNLRGWYVLPGLISCHSHLQALYPYSLRDENEPAALTALRASARARSALRVGITTIRCLHEQNRADLHVRTAAKRGWVEAPRILGAGRALTTPSGHGRGLGCEVADGPDSFLHAARVELAAGADHIKVFITGGLARASEPLDTAQMTGEEMGAVVQAASERRTYVAAHAATSGPIRQALAAGIRSFEHAYSLNTETAEALARAEAYLTPTLSVTHSPNWMASQGFDEASIRRCSAAREEHLESIRNAVRANVSLVNGTDFPASDPHEDTSMAVHEMELMVEAGLRPLQALQAATITAARLMRLEDRIGAVEPGFVADLVAVDGDPTAEIRNMRKLKFVMQGGRVIRLSAA